MYCICLIFVVNFIFSLKRLRVSRTVNQSEHGSVSNSEVLLLNSLTTGLQDALLACGRAAYVYIYVHVCVCVCVCVFSIRHNVQPIRQKRSMFVQAGGCKPEGRLVTENSFTARQHIVT